MKTKVHFPFVFALLFILVAASVGTAYAQTGITISPDALPPAAYQTQYSQQLTASGGVEPYTFSLTSGALPSGITLSSDGLLSGYPDGYIDSILIGTYPIAIQVVDASGAVANQNYDFVLNKGTPKVLAYAGYPTMWNVPITLWAEVKVETPYGYTYIPDGTMAFFIDDIPVPGCQAVSYNGYYPCENAVMNLAVGAHTVTAVYTPTVWNDPYYSSSSASSEFTVQPRLMTIQGAVFNDVNRNGEYDAEEYKLYADGWEVNLDQDCDEDIDYSTTTAWGGFEFRNIPVSGQCHRISVIGGPGYVQTTQVEDFIPGEYPFILFGFYYPNITVSPSEYNLPSASLGVAYNQMFTASGGTEPYTYTIVDGSLPAGLTLSADGILSGSPTATGNYNFAISVVDANQVVKREYHVINILADGDFTLTSSSNPSMAGDVVTFTVSATGDAVHSYYGPMPPVGAVTFFADGTPIDGCSDLYLNLSPDWDAGDFPATCTTAALGVGTHEITATYTDWYGMYTEPSLNLTQVVIPAVTADLAINKVDGKDLVKPGSKLVYTLLVSNLGPDPAESVTVTDKLDGNTTYISVSAPNGWTCSYAASSATVTCASESLASGSRAIIKVTVVVNKTAKVGKNLINNAFVSSTTFDPDLSNNEVVQKMLVAK